MKRPLLQQARQLRHEQTDHEAELWQYLRAKRFHDLKFYRQYVIAPYIVDFCCPSKFVIVELDGSWHLEPERQKKDSVRDQFIQNLGYRIFRVWNSEWRESRESVLEALGEFIC